MSVSRATCITNEQCVSELGEGACCLLQHDGDQVATTCQPKGVVNAILTNPNYNTTNKTFMDPTNGKQLIAYCMTFPTQPEQWERKPYPYQQFYLDDDFENTRDAQIPDLERNQFYVPKKVKNFEDQLSKWFICWFFTLIPLFDMVYGLNLFFGYVDGTFAYWGRDQSDNEPVIFNFYNSTLAEEALGIEPWGPHVWYDLFSLQGWEEYMHDKLMVWILFPIELMFAMMRAYKRNWDLYSSPNNHMTANRNYDYLGWTEPDFLLVSKLILDFVVPVGVLIATFSIISPYFLYAIPFWFPLS